MSRTVPSPIGQRALMHSSSSGARSRIECRGPTRGLPMSLTVSLTGGPLGAIGLFPPARKLRPIGLQWSFGIRRRDFIALLLEEIGAQNAALQGAIVRRPISLPVGGIERRPD